MLIRESIVGDVAVLKIESERLDMGTGPRIKRLIEEVIQRHPRIVLDMADVRFVDSSGFGAILSCQRDLQNIGGDLKLCGVHSRVRVLLELVRIHRVVEILNTVEEALFAFGSNEARRTKADDRARGEDRDGGV